MQTTGETTGDKTTLRAVRVWLIVVAAMIAAMVMVGGATRLTESGLSIVEWKPVTGTLPPLTQQAWDEAFEAYKQIPQYQQVNRGMSLDEFKTIFWWEWSHRQLGRAIGVVFLLPFLWFLWRGGLSRALKGRLWVMFVLGGLQGAVGWWMVASGLSGRTEVSQYRLAVHLLLALAIYSFIVWTLIRMTPRREDAQAPSSGALATSLKWIAALTFLQVYFGALVAGLRAGRAFNTWPLIDGAFIPSAERLFFEKPWWRNFFDSVLTVQWTHRMLAYLLLAAVLAHLVHVVRLSAGQKVIGGALAIVAAMAVQVTLGVLTLLNEVPIDLALAHQAGAIAVITLVLMQAARLGARPVSYGSMPSQAFSA